MFDETHWTWHVWVGWWHLRTLLNNGLGFAGCENQRSNGGWTYNRCVRTHWFLLIHSMIIYALCSLLDIPLCPQIRDQDEDQLHLIQGEWPHANGFEVAALGARARVYSANMQCMWMALCLPVPSLAVQLTCLMNSLAFGICRWHEHFESGVVQSIRAGIAIRVGEEYGMGGCNEWLSMDNLQVRAHLPQCLCQPIFEQILLSRNVGWKTSNKDIVPWEGEEWLGGLAYDIAICGCNKQICGWSIGSCLPLSFPNPF